MEQPIEDDEFRESLNVSDDEPSHDWSLDRLAAAAVDVYRSVLEDEKTTTARYWRLGKILRLARKSLNHGQWGLYLRQHKIDNTRAAKAMRISEAFPTAEATEGLTVEEAYQRRPRRTPLQKRRKGSGRRRKQRLRPTGGTRRWLKFTARIVAVVGRQLEEAEHLSAREAQCALEAVAKAVASMQQLEQRLLERAAAKDSAVSQNGVVDGAAPEL